MMLALVASILLFPAPVPPAPAVPPDVKTPEDPRKRIELAEKVNGLHGMDIPWHLKASFEVFSADGPTSEAGTYEEWRVSKKQYRVALHSPSLSVEEYGTEHGVFRIGQRDWPREPLSSITSLIAGPTFPHISDDTVFENYQQSFGAQKAPCTAIKKRSVPTSRKDSPAFCFAPANAVLLYATASNAANQTVFEHIRSLRGHYLAYDMKQYLEDKPWMKIHVDTLEGLGRAGLSALTVPAGAWPVTPRIHLTEQAPDRLISKVAPIYPLAARLHQFQGTVVLNGLIDKEGHVTWLRALAGPVSLQQPSLDAVRQWVYKPYLLDGQPAEVETEINLVFVLSSHQVVQ
jgi:Gram-negative bacterial TonB protein C-terminal